MNLKNRIAHLLGDDPPPTILSQQGGFYYNHETGERTPIDAPLLREAKPMTYGVDLAFEAGYDAGYCAAVRDHQQPILAPVDPMGYKHGDPLIGIALGVLLSLPVWYVVIWGARKAMGY